MKLKYYIDELKSVTSNRFSSEQSKYIYIGLIYEIINDKNLFKKNNDVAVFIKEVYNIKYKEYVFNSRNYVLSRLLSDLNGELNNKNYPYLIKSTKKIIYFLETSDLKIDSDELKDTNIRTKKSDNVIGWFNSVKNRSDIE